MRTRRHDELLDRGARVRGSGGARPTGAGARRRGHRRADGPRDAAVADVPHVRRADAALLRPLVLVHAPRRRRRDGHVLVRALAGEAVRADDRARDLRRRRRHRGGRAGARGGRRLPPRPGEVHEARRADPARRAPERLAGDGQDAARARGRRRGRRAVLLDVRLGVRRDDRRRRRLARARPVRAGEGRGALDRLRRRDRRDRAIARRRRSSAAQTTSASRR